MAIPIQFRRDGSSNWSTANPVMAEGEVGLDLNHSQFKIGNGVSSWNQLTFVGTAWSGGTLTVSAGTQSSAVQNIVFSNSNGVSFGLSAGTITASVSVAGGGVALSAGTTQQSTGTVVFSNSNGLAFGMNAGTITGSYTVPTVPAQSQQPMYYSAFGQSTSANTIQFGNSNNVTFSLSNGSVIASVNPGGGAAISAGAGSQNTGTIIFSNSGGVSFGLNAGTLTASVQAQQNAFSAQGGSSTFVTLNFVNTQGVSFSNSNGSLYGSVATSYAASNHSHGNPSLNLTNISGTTASGSAGFTLSLSGPNSVAGAAISAAGASQNTGTIIFSNSNGISFGMNAGTLTATVKTDYPTSAPVQIYFMTDLIVASNRTIMGYDTPANSAIGIVMNNSSMRGVFYPRYSVHTTGGTINSVGFTNQAVQTKSASPEGQMIHFVGWGQAKLGIQTNLSGSDFPVVAVSVPYVSMNYYIQGNKITNTNLLASQHTSSSSRAIKEDHSLYLQAAGGLSIGMSNDTIYFEGQSGGGGGGVAISAGAGSQNTGTIIFSDSNGLSFGLNAGTLTASHNGLTTARASNDAVGLGTALTAGPIAWTVNSGGISLNAGSAAGTTTGFGGNLISATMTHNTAGLNVSLNHPAWLTTAANSTHSHGNPTLNLTNLNGTTASASNGVTFSLSAPSQTNQTLGLYAVSNTTGGASSTSLDARSVSFQGAGIASVGYSNGSVVVSVPAGGGAGDGYNSAQFTNSTADSTQNIVWAGNSNGSGNITMGLTGSTVTMSAPSGGGGGYTAFTFQNRQLGASTTLNAGGGQNSLWLAPTRIAAPVSASTILAAMISYSGTITSAASAQMGQTLRVGIWSQHTDPASTTQFGQYWTGNASMTFWNSGTSSYSYAYSLSDGQTTGSSAGSNLGTASVMGVRQIIMPIGSTMTTGLYIMGILNSTSSAGYSAAMSRAALYMDNPMSVGQGTFGTATNASVGYQDGGTYGTTTASLPNTIALSQIKGVNNVMPYFKIGAL